MSTREKSISVEIYGESYNVRGEGDAEYLTELAQLVDARMHEIASRVSTADVRKIAILAALNLADEFSRHREHHREAVEHWVERTEELERRLRNELESPENETF
jgi:cell division protein ZapA